MNAAQPPPPPRRRRLSPLRILVAAGLIAGTVALTVEAVERATEPEPDTSMQWYAPYVDVTLPPLFDFQEPAVNPSRDVVLSFVVAARDDSCTPAWGAVFDLDEAADELDLDRRIALHATRGGTVIVSFGGAANDELATVCTDDDRLVSAYRTVIERYGIDTIDFDIEGDDLLDQEANARRAAAVAQLQRERAESGTRLAVWLTLPVAPTGMPESAVATVDAMLAAGVDLTGVNVMTMNYGPSREPDTSMVEASLDALDVTHRQLKSSYQRTGTTLDDLTVWTKIGATPMIGQNDYRSDRFTVKDAARFFEAARDRGIGRFSMWSLNRDTACGTNVDPKQANNHCSGVEQEHLEFTRIFDSLEGRPSEPEPIEELALPRAAMVIDDPATSPYPVWREGREYEEGEKVVWRQNVYEAKWWNTGEPPDAPIVNEWDSPWRLLGPVIPGEVTPTTTTTLPPGTYPTWSRTKVYDAGDRVQWNGVGYEAKWYSRNDTPGADVDNEWETPWQAIGPPDEEDDDEVADEDVN